MVDVVVIGAGPSGTAAAIRCAEAGLSVVICERQAFSAERHRPMESLHPGCISLIDQLGIGQEFRQANWPRFPGIEVAGHFRPFGADTDGVWMGYHIDRARFDRILQRHAEAVGVQILHNVKVLKLLRNEKQVLGVVMPEKELTAQWVIDASGRNQWAASKLGLRRKISSAPLMAWRGEVLGQLSDRRARFERHGDGWLWTVQTDNETIAWTLLAPISAIKESAPPVLAGSAVQLKARGFDVTWRAVRPVAMPGLLLVGEAAAQLDPAAGQGVFFALESGLRAAQTILECTAAPGQSALALARYDDWVMREFERKTHALRTMYADLDLRAHLSSF